MPGSSGPVKIQPALANFSQDPETLHSLLPYLESRKLYLRSELALVFDVNEGSVLYQKKKDVPRPIASVTKLLSAMVLIDAGLPESEIIQILKADRDRLRGSKSRLSFGTKMSRGDLLKISIAGSENRAAAALGRTYPGGKKAMVSDMNTKARHLGMKNTKFRDVSGLHSGNVSSPADLAVLVDAAYQYPLIRKLSTIKTDFVTDRRKGYKVRFVNTNRLVRNKNWNVELSKTGYIADSGHCLVMRVEIADRPVIIVLLNSWGKLSKYGDSNRIRKWLDQADKTAKKKQRAAGKTTETTKKSSKS